MNDDEEKEISKGGISETEIWAEEIIERARKRSENKKDDLDFFEKRDETGLGNLEVLNDSSFRDQLVTLEDIGDHDFSETVIDRSIPTDRDTFTKTETFYPSARGRAQKSILEWGIVIAGAIGLALIIKAFLFQAYYIPSPSMNPTLGEGDRILVNKLSYDLHDVNRGDLVVFKSQENSVDADDLIKRVIALSGEFITVENGEIKIDGGLLLEPYLPLDSRINSFMTPMNCVNRPGENTGCRIPDNHVFVMGDNRSNSRDSRFFGPVPEFDIEGRAFLRIWPVGSFNRL